MSRKNAFTATRLSGLYESLTTVYGHDKGSGIFSAAEKILLAELTNVNDRGNKMIGRHMRRNILPGYACYRAMLDSGISNLEVVEFMKDELCKSTERMAKFSKRLSLKSYTYGLIRFLMKVALNYGFPKQGWTAVMLESNKKQIRFDMTSCLYCEELQKRGALELCSAYCYTDVASYAPLAPAVLFVRQNTLAQTGVKCDFCIEKGTAIKTTAASKKFLPKDIG
jgi:hypothetical protein